MSHLLNVYWLKVRHPVGPGELKSAMVSAPTFKRAREVAAYALGKKWADFRFVSGKFIGGTSRKKYEVKTRIYERRLTEEEESQVFNMSQKVDPV